MIEIHQVMREWRSRIVRLDRDTAFSEMLGEFESDLPGLPFSCGVHNKRVHQLPLPLLIAVCRFKRLMCGESNAPSTEYSPQILPALMSRSMRINVI